MYILMVMDNFKSYDDNRGHLVGDKLLSHIGRLIQGAIRNVDFAFRYGGDKFAIIMTHTSAENAVPVADRIRNLIASETSDKKISITASIGITS
jgi:diguanylate cyclase (GGDEF)-like protein